MSDTPDFPIKLERKYFIKDDTWKQFSFNSTETTTYYYTGKKANFLLNDEYWFTCYEIDAEGKNLGWGIRLVLIFNYGLAPILRTFCRDDHSFHLDFNKLSSVYICGENDKAVFYAEASHPNGKDTIIIKHDLQLWMGAEDYSDVFELADSKLQAKRYSVGIGHKNLHAEVYVYTGSSVNSLDSIKVTFSGDSAQEDYDNFIPPSWFGEEIMEW